MGTFGLKSLLPAGLDRLDCGVFVTDANGGLLYANAWIVARLQLSTTEHPSLRALFVEGSAMLYERCLDDARRCGRSTSCELVIRPHTKVETHVVSWRDVTGTPHATGIMIPRHTLRLARTLARGRLPNSVLSGLDPVSTNDGGDTD